MISHETVTELNYRTAVPAGSEFSVINNFPEVYHGQEVSEPLFSAAARRATGQGRNTTYSVTVS